MIHVMEPGYTLFFQAVQQPTYQAEKNVSLYGKQYGLLTMHQCAHYTDLHIHYSVCWGVVGLGVNKVLSGAGKLTT